MYMKGWTFSRSVEGVFAGRGVCLYSVDDINVFPCLMFGSGAKVEPLTQSVTAAPDLRLQQVVHVCFSSW